MPTYEYECDACHRVFEIRQRISEPALTTCDVCGGSVRRLLSAAPFILKGEGWYVTDYPSEARKKGRDSEKSKSTPGAESKSATSDGSKSDGAKSDSVKSESGKSDSGKSDSGSSTSSGAASPASPKSD